MSAAILYPDVLGHITGGVRMDAGIVHAAAALHPNPVKAGRPMDMIGVLQNMTDAPLEVMVSLGIPRRDLNGTAGTFIAKVQRLAIGMQPHEVGILILPMITQPNTAPGQYTVALQVSAKSTGKANRSREADGGAAFYAGGMSIKAQKTLEALREMHYAGAAPKRGGLFGSGTPQIEIPLTLEEGSLGSVLGKSEAEYTPIWTKDDFMHDPLLLLEKHKAALKEYVLPTLDRERLHDALTYRTIDRFKEAGYNPKDIEAALVANVMVRVLEFAATEQPARDYVVPPNPYYAVQPILDEPPAERAPLHLNWLVTLLRLMEEDARIARFTSRFIPEKCYDSLLKDALNYGLTSFEALTGVPLGSPESLAQFSLDWVVKFESGEKLNFTALYVPLVIIGIALHDPAGVPEENLKMVHTQMQGMLKARKAEYTENTVEIFEIAQAMLENTLGQQGLLVEAFDS